MHFDFLCYRLFVLLVFTYIASLCTLCSKPWPEEIFPSKIYPSEYQKRIKHGLCINPFHFINDSSIFFFDAFTKQVDQEMKNGSLTDKSKLKTLFKNTALNCDAIDFGCLWDEIQSKKRSQKAYLHIGKLYAHPGDLLDQGNNLFSYFSLGQNFERDSKIFSSKALRKISAINAFKTIVKVPAGWFMFVHKMKIKKMAKEDLHSQHFSIKLVIFKTMLIRHCRCERKVLNDTILVPFHPGELLPIHQICNFDNPSLLYDKLKEIMPLLRNLVYNHGYHALAIFFPECQIRMLKFHFKLKMLVWHDRVARQVNDGSPTFEENVAYVIERIGENYSYINTPEYNASKCCITVKTFPLAIVWGYPNGIIPEFMSTIDANQLIAKLLILNSDKLPSKITRDYYLPWLHIFQESILVFLILFYKTRQSEEFLRNPTNIDSLPDNCIIHPGLIELKEFSLFDSNTMVMVLPSGSLFLANQIYCINQNGTSVRLENEMLHTNWLYLHDKGNQKHEIITIKR